LRDSGAVKKSNLRSQFGIRLRQLREESKQSQEAFADACGYARSYMSRIERGLGNPSLDAIEVLAAALKREVYELFQQDAGTNPVDTKPEKKPKGRA
jgi:transcriptional regulator with XRE-family HTH domain